MKFNDWLDTLISEKGIDLEETFEIENNTMPYGVVIEHIKIANKTEREAIKKVLVMIDFKNGDIKHFLRHIAQAIVIKI